MCPRSQRQLQQPLPQRVVVAVDLATWLALAVVATEAGTVGSKAATMPVLAAMAEDLDLVPGVAGPAVVGQGLALLEEVVDQAVLGARAGAVQGVALPEEAVVLDVLPKVPVVTTAEVVAETAAVVAAAEPEEVEATDETGKANLTFPAARNCPDGGHGRHYHADLCHCRGHRTQPASAAG